MYQTFKGIFCSFHSVIITVTMKLSFKTHVFLFPPLVKPPHLPPLALPVSDRGWPQRVFKDGGWVPDGPRASRSRRSHSFPNQYIQEMARSFCVAILGPPGSSQRPLQH